MAKKVKVLVYSVSGSLLNEADINTRKFDKKKKNGKDKNEVKIGSDTYEIIRMRRPFIADSDPTNDIVMKVVAKAV